MSIEAGRKAEVEPTTTVAAAPAEGEAAAAEGDAEKKEG